jgi:hypothetical protein
MMRWRRRIRRTLGIGCLGLAVSLSAMIPVNIWWSLFWSTDKLQGAFAQGTVVVAYTPHPQKPFWHGVSLRNRQGESFLWWPSLRSPPTRVWYFATIPNWMLILPSLAAATALARPELRAWSRRRRGRCTQCGYDRRGLAAADAVCPECGTKARRE